MELALVGPADMSICEEEVRRQRRLEPPAPIGEERLDFLYR